MSQTNLDRIGGSMPTDPILPDAGRGRARSADSGTFDGHLWRLRTQQATGAADLAQPTTPAAPPPEPPRPPVDTPRNADDRRREEPRDSGDVDGSENVAGAPPETTENQTADTREQPQDSRSDDDRPDNTVDDKPAASAEKPADPESDDDSAPVDEVVSLAQQPIDVLQNNEDASAEPSPETAPEVKGERPHAENDAKPVTPDSETVEVRGAENQAAKNPSEKQPETGDEAAAQVENRPTDAVASPTVAQTEDTPLDDLADPADLPASDRQSGRHPADAAASRETRAPREQPADSPQAQQASATKSEASGVPLPPDVANQTDDQTDEPPNHHQRQPSENQAAVAAQSSTGVELAAASESSDDDAAAPIPDAKVAAVDDAPKPATMSNAENRLNPDARVASARSTTQAETSEAQKSGDSIQVDRGRFVQRVARAFSAIGKHDGSVRLRLSPPELGSLRLEISVRNGQMTARVEAETSTARNLLLDNLPALRDRLAQQDIKVRQFDIQLMDQSAGGLPDRTADHTAYEHHGGHHASRSRNDSAPETASAAATPRSRPGDESQLNVVI